MTRRARLFVAIAASVLCGLALSTPIQAQTTPTARPTGGELVPFWLVIPEYPGIARSARLQGVVIVALTVGLDGRVESATFERDIPLLSRAIIDAAKDSGFICRGCTRPMAYRIAYDFGLVPTIEETLAVRADVTATAATLRVYARPIPPVDWLPSTQRHAMSRPSLEHAEQEP